VLLVDSILGRTAAPANTSRAAAQLSCVPTGAAVSGLPTLPEVRGRLSSTGMTGRTEKESVKQRKAYAPDGRKEDRFL